MADQYDEYGNPIPQAPAPASQPQSEKPWWQRTAEEAGINPWQQDYKQEFQRTSGAQLAQMSPEQRARWSLEHIDDLSAHSSDRERNYNQWMAWQDSFDPNCPSSSPYQAEDGSGCVEKPDNSNKGYEAGAAGGGGGGGGAGERGQEGFRMSDLINSLDWNRVQGISSAGTNPKDGALPLPISAEAFKNRQMNKPIFDIGNNNLARMTKGASPISACLLAISALILLWPVVSGQRVIEVSDRLWPVGHWPAGQRVIGASDPFSSLASWPERSLSWLSRLSAPPAHHRFHERHGQSALRDKRSLIELIGESAQADHVPRQAAQQILSGLLRQLESAQLGAQLQR